jgi:hypothetical protein
VSVLQSGRDSEKVSYANCVNPQTEPACGRNGRGHGKHFKFEWHRVKDQSISFVWHSEMYVLLQGALTRVNGTAAGEGEEEYVIFDGHQALPLYLIEYSATPLKQPIQKPTTGVSRDLKPNPFEDVEPQPEPEPELEREPKLTRTQTETSQTADPLLQKLGEAGGGGAMKVREGVAMTPRDLQARRECSDAELLSALRKIRATEGNDMGQGQTPAAAPIGCKKVREIGA